MVRSVNFFGLRASVRVGVNHHQRSSTVASRLHLCFERDMMESSGFSVKVPLQRGLGPGGLF